MAVTAADLDQVQAALDTARSALDAAQAALDQCYAKLEGETPPEPPGPTEGTGVAMPPADVAWFLNGTPNGATGQYYHRGLQEPWRNLNGDWLDTAGQLNGTAAWQTIPCPNKGATPIIVSGDVSALVAASPGFVEIILTTNQPRTLAGLGADPSAAPTLQLVYEDDTVGTVTCDCALTLSTSSVLVSAGPTLTLAVSPLSNVALRFPAPQKPVTSATLAFKVLQGYGADGNIFVWQLATPPVPLQVPAAGSCLSATYLGDVGMAGDPAVITVLDFGSGLLDDYILQPTQSAPLDWTNGKNYDYSGADGAKLPQVAVRNGRLRFVNGATELPLQIVDAQFSLYGFAAPTSGGKALMITGLPGTQTMADMVIPLGLDANGNLPDHVFVRQRWKLGDDAYVPDDTSHTGGKWGIGVSHRTSFAGNGGGAANGKNGWSNRGGGYWDADAASPTYRRLQLWSYEYNLDRFQDGFGLGMRGARTPGAAWFDLEVELKLNTPGQADGILRYWIDDALAFEGLDYRWRSTPPYEVAPPGYTGSTQYAVANLGAKEFWLNCYFGGSGMPVEQAQHIFLANVVCATKRIGRWRDQPATQNRNSLARRSPRQRPRPG
jgi:hypothetical protein